MESRGHRSTAGGEFGNGSTNFRTGGDTSVSTCILQPTQPYNVHSRVNSPKQVSTFKSTCSVMVFIIS